MINFKIPKRIFALLSVIAFAAVSAQATPVHLTNGNLNEGFVANTPTGWTAITPTGEAWQSLGNSASPDGGAYWGVQYLQGWGGRFSKVGIFQDMKNLEINAEYQLIFYSMGNHTNSNQQEHWDVTIGKDIFSGATVDAATSKWTKNTINFTATDTTQLLKFASVFTGGTPGVSPEVLNLDGISITKVAAPPATNHVPEPASAALLLLGLAGVAAASRAREK